MREAMSNWKDGSLYFGEDTELTDFEKQLSGIIDKDRAILLPTGCMANQISLMAHCQPSDLVIVSKYNHIVIDEAGGPGVFAKCNTITLQAEDGVYDLTKVEQLLEERNGKHRIHKLANKIKLICIENPIAGNVIDLEYMRKLRELTNKYGVSIHLDGARLFNAAAVLNCEVKQITKFADSVMFCFSKALSCPIGSALGGNSQFIQKAEYFRFLLGGQMGSMGMLASAAQIALKDILPQLQKDHQICSILHKQMKQLPEIEVEQQKLTSNMVFWQIKKDFEIDWNSFQEFLLKNKMKISGSAKQKIRFVVHHYIREKEVDQIINILKEGFQLQKKKI